MAGFNIAVHDRLVVRWQSSVWLAQIITPLDPSQRFCELEVGIPDETLRDYETEFAVIVVDEVCKIASITLLEEEAGLHGIWT